MVAEKYERVQSGLDDQGESAESEPLQEFETWQHVEAQGSWKRRAAILVLFTTCLVLTLVTVSPQLHALILGSAEAQPTTSPTSLRPVAGAPSVTMPSAPQRTSPPTLDPYAEYDVEGASWQLQRRGAHSFQQRQGICYFENTIRHVNNRPGDPLTCFSSCTGLNLQLRDTDAKMQCVGWTLVRSRICNEAYDSDDEYDGPCNGDELGSSVCLLHHTLNEDKAVKDPACWSGKLLPKDLFIGQAANRTAEPQVDAAEQNADEYGGQEKTAEETLLEEQAEEKAQELADATFVEEDFNSTCPERAKLMGDQLTKRPMRVFIACVQASGCTLLSFLLAQRDGTTSILDLGVRQTVPTSTAFYERALLSFPKVDTIVIKISIRGSRAQDPRVFMEHVQAGFNPDVSILFVRDPVDSLLHMATHISKALNGNYPSDAELARCQAGGDGQNSYGLTCGRPESKLDALDKLYAMRDNAKLHVITFEEVCSDRVKLGARLSELGICIPAENLQSPKWSIVDVMRYSFKYFLSARATDGGVFWGVGNLRNTFHDKFGFPKAEEQAFKICAAELDHSTRRPILLKAAAKPYGDMTMEQVHEKARQSAPLLYSLYHSDAAKTVKP